MKDLFYNAIKDHVTASTDDDKVYGVGSAADECVVTFKNELTRILLALSNTPITEESKQTFIQEIIQKYGI